ncbi:Reticulocalbin-2 [Chionoecetes opilio]|uniref:Reticulocalbin-2 n=1 Tax=Chionoecetes opilio TaxID=41210 RepID=A0A8J4XPI0_CHIOP|nr:Reticulocalbin-2 [Chionoecetes opilio]
MSTPASLTPDEYTQPSLTPDEYTQPSLTPDEYTQPSLTPDEYTQPSLTPDEYTQPSLTPDEDIAEDEVDHLFGSADDDGDDLLSFLEVLDHHDVFVGSEATDYGDHLHNLDRFEDEL